MARGIPDYDELRIRIEPRPDGDFQVAAFGPYGSSAGGNFALPFDERDLDLFVLRVGVRKCGVRSAGSSHLAEVKRVGSTLFDALVKDAFATCTWTRAAPPSSTTAGFGSRCTSRRS